ncbi:hypothetical protein DM860_014543 [Cuscuta australis]|uniref:Uncharacterized protein n=1 Tax=Cuscuta australis TaxID=267555 RepID=A0A328E2E0_9ASTE|nr:hypothetical protein DM860_014543 [Cuscuta australis]
MSEVHEAPAHFTVVFVGAKEGEEKLQGRPNAFLVASGKEAKDGLVRVRGDLTTRNGIPVANLHQKRMHVTTSFSLDHSANGPPGDRLAHKRTPRVDRLELASTYISEAHEAPAHFAVVFVGAKEGDEKLQGRPDAFLVASGKEAKDGLVRVGGDLTVRNGIPVANLHKKGMHVTTSFSLDHSVNGPPGGRIPAVDREHGEGHREWTAWNSRPLKCPKLTKPSPLRGRICGGERRR